MDEMRFTPMRLQDGELIVRSEEGILEKFFEVQGVTTEPVLLYNGKRFEYLGALDMEETLREVGVL